MQKSFEDIDSALQYLTNRCAAQERLTILLAHTLDALGFISKETLADILPDFDWGDQSDAMSEHLDNLRKHLGVSTHRLTLVVGGKKDKIDGENHQDD